MDGKNSPRDRLLGVGETSHRLGYRPQTLYNWAGALAELPFFRIGRSIRFSEADIEKFLEARRVEPLVCLSQEGGPAGGGV